jgi:hypothetical protein
MANLPISGLPAASSLDGTELLPFVQGGVTTQATAQDILNANLPVTSSGITLTGDIVPSTPQGANLGSIDKPFAELYLQSGSISIESDTPGDPSAIISNVSGNLEISVGGMLLVESGSSFTSPTGSFDKLSADLTENYVWIGDSNNKNIETPVSSLSTYLTGSLVKSAYGSFYSTQNQAGLANEIQVITHNVTDFASGVSMVSGSQITFAEAGIYTLISTMQYQETGGGTATITGWLRKNGVDVADSATDLKLKGNGDRDLYAINYFVSASAGDYVEFCWSSNDVDTNILYIAPRTSPTRPAVPSVITTVNRVG